VEGKGVGVSSRAHWFDPRAEAARQLSSAEAREKPGQLASHARQPGAAQPLAASALAAAGDRRRQATELPVLLRPVQERGDEEPQPPRSESDHAMTARRPADARRAAAAAPKPRSAAKAHPGRAGRRD